MKLEDCNLRAICVVMQKDPTRANIDDSWNVARVEGSVPEMLFRFYTNADYFSPEAAPPFLRDKRRFLFSYLGTVTEAAKECLVEATQFSNEIKSLELEIYSPFKKAKGETWNPDAARNQRRVFRYFLLNLSSSLDMFAEVLAIFFHAKIPRLRLGRGQFSHVHEWLRRPIAEAAPETERLIETSLTNYHIHALHERLAPLVQVADERHDWMSLFFLYRNKLSHFGAHHALDFRLHDHEGRFYAFLPRVWPFIWQQYLQFQATPEQVNGKNDAQDEKLRQTIRSNCIHVDLIEFVEGVASRVYAILEQGFDILLSYYDQLKDIPQNSQVLADLEQAMNTLPFTRFDGAPETGKGASQSS